MGSISLRLPKVCAWCGQREGTMNENVTLSFAISSRVRRTLRLQLPICPECRMYVGKLKNAEMQTKLGMAALAFIIGALGTLLFSPPGDSIIATIAAVSVVLFIVIWIVMAASGLERKLLDKMTGPKPAGYSSKSSSCCAMVGPQHLRFYNPVYQTLFKQLNPHNVR
ncbi:MAG: hypothetical protein JXA21_07800 [Anaerolineae bacterium]|nr:hypothetical protein [Anaerolineae bacterium]